MRETQPLDPMWENAEHKTAGSRVIAGAAAVVGGAARRVAPHLLRWVKGREPELRFGWGPDVFHLRKDGLLKVRRDGPGWEDNPRTNYNERVEKRQARAAGDSKPASAPDSAAPAPGAPAARKIDMSAGALQAEVNARMGIAEAGHVAADDGLRDPVTLKAELIRFRTLLAELDDVADWSLVEAVDDELYSLHKAVEYKLKNHKASEAKSKLDSLFK